jgi:hypothetical protein
MEGALFEQALPVMRHRARRPVTGGHAVGARWSKAGEHESGHKWGSGVGARWARPTRPAC